VVQAAGHGQLRPYGQFRPDRQPIVIVHGANSNPEELRSIIERYEADPHYQIYVFFYDDQGQYVDTSGNDLAQGLEELRTQYLAKFTDRPVVQVIAHSMGGMVARAAMNSLADPNWRPSGLRLGARDHPPAQATAQEYGGINLVAIDTPWEGSAGPPFSLRGFLGISGTEASAADMTVTSEITTHISAPRLPSNFTFNEIEAYDPTDSRDVVEMNRRATGWGEIGDMEARAMIRFFGSGDTTLDRSRFLVNMLRALQDEEDYRTLRSDLRALARSGDLTTPRQLRGLLTRAVERVGGPGDLVGHSGILTDPRLFRYLDRWLSRH
jgi:pimeloyl-ACP methyl ester carboxylesterase